MKEIWNFLENLKKYAKLKAHYVYSVLYKMYLHKNLKNMVNAFASCVEGDLRKLQMKINYCRWKDDQSHDFLFVIFCFGFMKPLNE